MIFLSTNYTDGARMGTNEGREGGEKLLNVFIHELHELHGWGMDGHECGKVGRV
ncbi:MAG: hypothetical protein ACOYMF_15180 [Bacteroidales bacterium]